MVPHVPRLLGALAALLAAAPATASAAGAPRPALEVVVTGLSDGRVLVGVGEPPGGDRVAGLVYLGAPVMARDVEVVAGRVRALAAAAGGTAGLRVYGAADGHPLAAEVLDLLAPHLPGTLAYVAGDEDPGAAARMTADGGGYHRRDDPGHPADDAADAVRTLDGVMGYGSGHAEPVFEPAPGGGMTRAHAAGWSEDAAGFTCPFPANPAAPPPPGMALELTLADGSRARQEALATWCDAAARGLMAECGAAGLMDALEAGAATARVADAPDEGRWWLPLEGVAAAGSMTADPCLSAGLAGVDVGTPYAGRLLELRLVEADLSGGCGRAIQERCR